MKCPQCGTEYMAFELVCPHCGREADAAALEAEHRKDPYVPRRAAAPLFPGKQLIRMTGVFMCFFGFLMLLCGIDIDYPFMIVASIIEVVFGIIGRSLASKTGKAAIPIMILGLILFALQAIEEVFVASALGGSDGTSMSSSGLAAAGSFAFVINGLLWPILFLLGGNMRRRAKT